MEWSTAICFLYIHITPSAYQFSYQFEMATFSCSMQDSGSVAVHYMKRTPYFQHGHSSLHMSIKGGLMKWGAIITSKF